MRIKITRDWPIKELLFQFVRQLFTLFQFVSLSPRRYVNERK